MITLCYSVSLWIASKFIPNEDKDILAFMLIGMLVTILPDVVLFAMLISVLIRK